MNRRHVLAAGAALLTISDTALGQSTHAHHAGASQLLDAASNCVKLGLVCIDHCQQTLASGDTSLAACERSVDQMVSICGTLAKLASVNSSYLAGLARVALVACQDCETECRKHADKHFACKACAEACVDCAAECKRTAA
jgi:Cys-rich four helix bundle protein (predicted Tat secretion target)